MTTNLHKFGQNSGVEKDVSTFSKESKNGSSQDEIIDYEGLRLDELNQKDIDDFVAEANLEMEILPVNDLCTALHNFVNKGDNMAFYSCLQNNLGEARDKIAEDSDVSKFEEGECIVKAGRRFEEHIKQRGLKPSDAQHFTSTDVSKKARKTIISITESDISFGDDEGAKLGVKDIADSSDYDEPDQVKELLQLEEKELL